MTGVFALALVAAMALAACGHDVGSDSSSGSDVNDADVTFAQSMIPHHEQAVEMAKMAELQASSTEVRDLAARIEAAQGPEIATMSGWLEAWGKDVPSGDRMGGMDHGSDGMPGMMDADDMALLHSSTGAGFDRMFLTMMIEHHEGAIEMAKTEQSDGKHPDAIDLAEKIEADQTAEIAVMQDLLKS